MIKRILLILTVIIVLCTGCGGGSSSKESYKLDLSQSTLSTDGLKLKYGDLLDLTRTPDGKGVVIKTKITSSANNEMTVRQNYHTICDLITDKGFDACSEIQYWAVADMTNGKEAKVVSFTLNEDTIQKIKAGSIVATELGDYADDLFIHQSLQ